MLRIDIQQVTKYGDTFFSENDTAYLIFLVMGIVGYFTVPSVANYIVHAGGGNALLYKASNVFTGGSMAAVSTVTAGSSAMFNSSSNQSQPTGSGQSTQETELKVVVLLQEIICTINSLANERQDDFPTANEH